MSAAPGRGLSVVAPEALAVYPLRRGETLHGLTYFSLRHHALLGSGLVSRWRHEHWGAALMLWAASIGSQDPAGTLPDDDRDLAHLAQYGRDVEAWRVVRPGALWGWRRVMVLDQDGGESGVRLAHPSMTLVVEEMMQAVERRGAQTSDALARKNFGRLRKKIEQEIGTAASAAAVRAVEAWLTQRGRRRDGASVAEAVRAGVVAQAERGG